MTALIIIGFILLVILATWVYAGLPGVGKARPRPDFFDRTIGNNRRGGFNYGPDDPRM